jgi:putative transposase
MPRPPRIAPAGIPLHIVQRGVNKQRCFFGPHDNRLYLTALAACSRRYCVDVHAYVLMTNHVHLLVTPREEGAASRMMQQLGRRYVGFFNKRHDRTGTLWEGRFRSSQVLSDRYLFACYRYIEMNPVRAGITASPDRYYWSSYGANALGEQDDLITPHELWSDLGATPGARCERYRRMFEIGNTASENRQIRSSNYRNRPLK